MNVVINVKHAYLHANIRLFEEYAKTLKKELFFYRRSRLSVFEDIMNREYKKISRDNIKIDSDLFDIEVVTKDLGENIVFPDLVHYLFKLPDDDHRNDPNLVLAVENLSSEFPEYQIVEIPNNARFYIESNEDDYGEDVSEYIAEVHRVWYYKGEQQ